MTKHETELPTAFEDSVSEFAGLPMAVALCDLDGFAGINERFGRDVGDAVLRGWERTLRGSLPKDAVVARVGGDEYAAALPEHSAESALIVLEEIRKHFAAQYPTKEIPSPVSVSAGIAARPPHGDSAAELLAAAREALMRAKRADRRGEGCVAIFVEEKMTMKSNYYTRATLDRLAKLSNATGRTEASLLREALDELLVKYRDEL
ncbi:MAG TPA: GGDEF domain-containing protein [Acidimicrobiales bacterium]|nr:GGDEF domain-containing protein [Acidimicrobiales bacterium]